MSIYKYRAKNGPTNIVEGTVDAKTKDEAIEKINQMGYVPVRVEETVASEQRKTAVLNKAFGRVSGRQITVFSRQMASLLKSGVPILNAIHIIGEQSDSPNLKAILGNIYKEIKEGKTFSDALSRYTNLFSTLYISTVRTGENSGRLQEVLMRIADYRQKQEEIISRVRAALAYPVLMVIVGIATIIFMFTFVMPRLTQIFASMEQNLPLPTTILISITTFLRKRGLWVFIVLAIFVLLFRRQAKTKAGKFAISLFELKLPVIGEFILKAQLSRFSRALELLIRSGVPILKAIEVSVPLLENEILKQKMSVSYKELEHGQSLGRSLKGLKVIPAFMSNLITVGEESGRIEEALGEVATAYERDTDEALKIMTSLLEPVIILVMGLVVGFIVISMLLPIFQINTMAM